jgi:hypothetical protein
MYIYIHTYIYAQAHLQHACMWVPQSRPAIVRFDISSSSEDEVQGDADSSGESDQDELYEEEMDPELLGKLQLLSATLIQRTYR